jgi:hypothetical protein
MDYTIQKVFKQHNLSEKKNKNTAKSQEKAQIPALLTNSLYLLHSLLSPQTLLPEPLHFHHTLHNLLVFCRSSPFLVYSLEYLTVFLIL